MKTIHLPVIDPGAHRTIRDYEIIVDHIVGWYDRGEQHKDENYDGSTTFVTISAGVEYEIAEAVESFRLRLQTMANGSTKRPRQARRSIIKKKKNGT